MDEFIYIVRCFKWEGRFLHPLFRSSFSSADILIKFLYSLQSRGKNVFQDAVSSELRNLGETKFGEHSRKGVVSYLMKYMNEDDGPRCSKFQVQVFMRTIETCIQDPFGDVNV